MADDGNIQRSQYTNTDNLGIHVMLCRLLKIEKRAGDWVHEHVPKLLWRSHLGAATEVISGCDRPDYLWQPTGPFAEE